MNKFTRLSMLLSAEHGKTRLFAICILVCLDLLTASYSAGADTAASADGFVSIFDGQTLDGWEATPRESAMSWTVRDGMIVGVGFKSRSHLIYSRNKEIGNFELRFSYRLPGEGNTGVNIRAIPDPTKKRDFQSYHADIGHLGIGKEVLGAWDFHTPGRTEHRCFQGDSLVIDKNDQPTITPIVNGLKDEHIKDRDWNEAHVIAQDNSFRLLINGKLASEFTEHLPLERRLLKGMLQLQLHDPGMIVHFKDIRLKVLD